MCVRIPGGALSRLGGDMAFVHVFKVLAQEAGNRYIQHALCSLNGENKSKRLKGIEQQMLNKQHREAFLDASSSLTKEQFLHWKN